jgi:WD40 repeat protein
MSEPFSYDVLLCHSSKDKGVARAVAARLKSDGLRVWFDAWEISPGDNIPSKIESGLENSRVIVLFMSASAFGSDWAQLEPRTFRFRDPLNKERRFIPLRLDESSIRGSLVQFRYINWLPSVQEQEYPKLLEACRPPAKPNGLQSIVARSQTAETIVQLKHNEKIWAYAFSSEGRRAVSAGYDHTLRLWEVDTGRLIRALEGHTAGVMAVAWSDDQQLVLSGGDDGDDTLRLWNAETGECLRVMKGHKGYVKNLAWSQDHSRALSVGSDGTMRLWDVGSGRCLRVFKGHRNASWAVAWSTDERRALSGSTDKTLRLWDVETGTCLRVLEGHTDNIRAVALSPDNRHAVSGSDDTTMRLWDVEEGRCLRVLKGHLDEIWKVAWRSNQSQILSGSHDKTVRLWDVKTGRCTRILEGHSYGIRSIAWSADGCHAFSGDVSGVIRVWDVSESISEPPESEASVMDLPATLEQFQYTNAKVLLVGDTGSGKSGLASRLATGGWKPSDGSTIGAWSTQWKLPEVVSADGLDREIWLWDFGGQADQRLVHQLYMDHTAMVLLLFDADREEDVLPGLREWQTALRRSVPPNTPQFLVAGRTDAGFKVSRAKLQSFALEHGFGYYETSAKESWGCPELIRAIVKTIPWATVERRTSPRMFKHIKDEILKLRDAGQILYTFKELREVLRQNLLAAGTKDHRFTDETLQTVIGLLDGPGAVKELEYGSYILLQPEWVNVYAQAVIRTLRQEPSELGCLPLYSIAEGQLLFQTLGSGSRLADIRRLPAFEERVVLREMERQLEARGLCLRQGGKLVFPSHCGRDRPAVGHHPPVLVSYTVQGYLDDIYATLVVKLAESEAFKLNELWRDSADFETLSGHHHMGVKLTRDSVDSGDISVYFGGGVTGQEQVIFANYIHAHLEVCSEKVRRLRYYVCPYCNKAKGNPQVLMEKLISKKEQATVECDFCERRFDLWDDLERRFASDSVREQVEGLRASDVIRLDTRRKGKLLALEVSARITSADQKCFEIPSTEDEGLDMELEFTDEDGSGTGKRLYLQLKSGNSHLRTRVKDGAEIFEIREQRWVDYWLKQPYPVMLVVGSFAVDDECLARKDKLEFADVRWMEISSVLKRESQNGRKPVKQIEFKGERLDLASVRRWRNKALAII